MFVSTQLLSPFYSDQDLKAQKVKDRVKASLPTSVNFDWIIPHSHVHCLLCDFRSCQVENIRHHDIEWNKGEHRTDSTDPLVNSCFSMDSSVLKDT